MSLIKKRRGGNGSSFPSLKNDFLSNRLFTPGMIDFDYDFWNQGFSSPPANITETDKDFKLELSVPGMKKEDFNIDVEDGAITISSEKEEEKKEDDKNYKRREFSYSSFSRTFQLPDNVDENNINARYDNGMLQLTIPKKEMAVSNPKKQIKVG
jgi:HSP20 family protein